jgi:hypothetical protein
MRVASSDDLVDLYGRYIAMVESGCEERLELDFAPGVYGVASIGPISLDLGGNPAPRDPRIDVVLRGTPGAPAVLRDLGILINARSVHLENLVITGRPQKLLECRVAKTFTMKSCVIAGNTWGGPWDGVSMHLSGVAGKDAYVVRIEDSWFVNNDQQSRAALLMIRGATGSYVERVELCRVGFVGNRTDCDLVIDEAREIQLEEVLGVKDEGTAILRCTRSERAQIGKCTFVVRSPHAIAVTDVPILARDTTVYASEPAPMAGVAMRDRAELRARGSLDEALASLSVPFAAARGRVADALGLQC